MTAPAYLLLKHFEKVLSAVSPFEVRKIKEVIATLPMMINGLIKFAKTK